MFTKAWRGEYRENSHQEEISERGREQRLEETVLRMGVHSSCMGAPHPSPQGEQVSTRGEHRHQARLPWKQPGLRAECLHVLSVHREVWVTGQQHRSQWPQTSRLKCHGKQLPGPTHSCDGALHRHETGPA